MSLNTDCRIYVCKSYFGGSSQCKKFTNISEYRKWIDMHPQEVSTTTFVPICGTKEVFDQMILSWKSGRLGIVDILPSFTAKI